MRKFIVLLFLINVHSYGLSAADGIPEAVLQRLNEEYPGWKLATVSPSVWADFKKNNRPHNPSLVRSDFDKDGRPDWAIQLALVNSGEEEQFVTVFLSRDDGFEEAIVESRGLDPAIYLTSRKKEVEELASGKQQINKRSELVVAGGPLGDSIYYWEGGQFREAPPDATLIPNETLTIP